MKSGGLYILRAWTLRDSTLEGHGQYYTAQRDSQFAPAVALPLDSIALLETDAPGTAYPFGAQALAVLTTVSAVVSAACSADPKSCFGSCPTFYLESDRSVPVAEGFSASVARALEARDVDALYGARSRGTRFALEMRNEALETHAVRTVQLLAAPRPAGGRVFAAADGQFYQSTRLLEPLSCEAPDGDCAAAVRAFDRVERRSAADPTDLARPEVLELEFPATRGSIGIVLGARNTLLSTFLFYQTLAYMGSRAGEYLAMMERGGPAVASDVMAMADVLGGIAVDVLVSGGAWRRIGTYREAGPIASDVTVFPFVTTEPDASVRVRLRMARGHWRLGYVALAQLGEPVTPVALGPAGVRRGDRADTAALAALRDPQRYLVTYPGARYLIEFDVPPLEGDAELFLESRGYYYEWMRREWLAQEDSLMVALVLRDPAEALRRLAGPYKARESTMERTFWASRFGRAP